MSVENPYQAPATEVQESLEIGGAPGPHNYASLVDRFLGSLIDGIIAIVVAFVVSFLIIFLISSGSDEDLEFWEQLTKDSDWVTDAIILLLVMIIYIGIQWSFWNATSQSIGKKVMKTQIVNLDGTPTDVKTIAFKRYALIGLAGLIPGKLGQWAGIVDVLFIFRRERNCLHDDIAQTRVIKLPAPTH